MAHGPLYRVPMRRRREGKTNYRSRLGLLKSGEARVVVRTSNRNVVVQFVNYDEKGDNVVASAEARELPKMGYSAAGSNTPSAYLAGRLAAVRAKEAGVSSGVLDLGLAKPHKGGVIFSALKGVVDGGIEVPAGDVFPPEERLRAEHLGEQKAAAFAASYEKIVGSPLPPKQEKKPAKGKGGAPQKGQAQPAKDDKKAKTPK